MSGCADDVQRAREREGGERRLSSEFAPAFGARGAGVVVCRWSAVFGGGVGLPEGDSSLPRVYWLPFHEPADDQEWGGKLWEQL